MRRAGFLVAIVSAAGCLTAPVRTEQPAPPAPLPLADGRRVAAEWEPVAGVLIGWPLRLPDALVVALAQEVDLFVSVHDHPAAELARRQFAGLGIDPKRIRFVVAPHGCGYYVTRDWGPFAAFDEDGQYRLVDGWYRGYSLGIPDGRHLFTPPFISGLLYRRENLAPAAVARAVGCPFVELPLALTGGNLAFDGQGAAFATDVMLGENRQLGIDRETFLAIAERELGVRRFHFVPNFECFGIQHLDCLMKLLDEERMLVKHVPPDHPDAGHVERATEYLSRLIAPSGRPYQVLRIDTPPYAANHLANYTNSAIVNRTVFVPLFGIPGDAAALDVWRAAMPGYVVRGFEHGRWSYTDALHCRVRGVWDPGMLYLAHPRPASHGPPGGTLTLEAHVRDYSGAGLIESQLQLVWRRRGEVGWRTLPLRRGEREHRYSGVVEGVRPRDVVEYYFAAASRSGRQETLPRTAPAGVYTFDTGEAGWR